MPVAAGYNTRWRRNQPPGQVPSRWLPPQRHRSAYTTRDDTDMKHHTFYHTQHPKCNTLIIFFFAPYHRKTYPIPTSHSSPAKKTLPTITLPPYNTPILPFACMTARQVGHSHTTHPAHSYRRQRERVCIALGARAEVPPVPVLARMRARGPRACACA